MISKIHLYDDCWIGLAAVYPSAQERDNFFNETGRELLDHTYATLTLLANIPVLARVKMSNYGMTIKTLGSQEIKTFVPSVEQLKRVAINDRQTLIELFKYNGEAAAINAQAMLSDGVDHSITMMYMPMALIERVLITADKDILTAFLAKNWSDDAIMAPISEAIGDIMEAEWQRK